MINPEDADSYRLRQEAFVSNLSGTSMTELLLVSTPIPIGLWLLSEAKAQTQSQRNAVANFILETLLILFPCLASMVWPGGTILVLISMAFACASYRLKRFLVRSRRPKTAASASGDSSSANGSTMDFALEDVEPSHLRMADPVSNFRASLMVMTCISILAVDFQVFPRRFAKTEMFGTGLMDLGVGVTVFASGLASGCRAKRQSERARYHAWRTIFRDTSWAVVCGWPLAALGVSRLVVIKALGYQEHVSEYGVHWNFFATLFCVRLLVVPMTRLLPARQALCLALLSLLLYQGMLSDGLSDFILHAPRDTRFSMNREGVLGIIGFLTIYFIAEELGTHIRAHRYEHHKHHKHQNQKEREPARRYHWNSLVRLGWANIILWGLTLLSDKFVQPVSRRMMNLSYVLWVSAHSALVLTMLMVVDRLSSRPQPSQILTAVNMNMFPVFMVANLATGAVNVSMRTLEADSATAVTILAIYIVSVSVVAITLANLKIVIRV